MDNESNGRPPELPLVKGLKFLKHEFDSDWGDNNPEQPPRKKPKNSASSSVPKLSYSNIDGYILWSETALDDGILSLSQQTEIEKQINRMIDRPVGKYGQNPQFYKLLELNALFSQAAGADIAAENYLLSALNLMQESDTFVSYSARRWYEDRISQGIAAEEREADKNFSHASEDFSLSKKQIIWLSVISVLLGLYFGATPVANWYTLQNADPQIVGLAEQVEMNSNGKLFLLRTHPEILSGTDFTDKCSTPPGGYIEQGCFLAGSSLIYVRQLPEQFASQEAVAAAHEMLHAAYEGLSSKQRDRVNEMLESAYSELNNEELNKRMVAYEQAEPGSRDNELHSILGTEFAGLSTDLENYYARYFTNRQTVVDTSSQAEQIFSNDRDEINNLGDTVDAEIKQTKSDYSWHVYYANTGNRYYWNYYWEKYNADYDKAQSDIEAYNSKVDNFNQLVKEYNGETIDTISPLEQQTQN